MFANNITYSFIIFYIIRNMDKIEEDVKILEEDLNEIRCNPIIKFVKDCYKCIEDVWSYFFIKMKN